MEKESIRGFLHQPFLLQSFSDHLCQRPPSLAAVEAGEGAAKDAEGVLLLNRLLHVLHGDDAGHQVGKGLAIVLLVVVEEERWIRAGSSSFSDLLADVHRVA